MTSLYRDQQFKLHEAPSLQMCQATVSVQVGLIDGVRIEAVGVRVEAGPGQTSFFVLDIHRVHACAERLVPTTPAKVVG